MGTPTSYKKIPTPFQIKFLHYIRKQHYHKLIQQDRIHLNKVLENGYYLKDGHRSKVLNSFRNRFRYIFNLDRI